MHDSRVTLLVHWLGLRSLHFSEPYPTFSGLGGDDVRGVAPLVELLRRREGRGKLAYLTANRKTNRELAIECCRAMLWKSLKQGSPPFPGGSYQYLFIIRYNQNL